MDKYLYLRSRAMNNTGTESKGMMPELSFTELEFSTQLSKYAELEKTWLVLFIIILTVLVVCLLLLLVLRKRINIAVALIGQASK